MIYAIEQYYMKVDASAQSRPMGFSREKKMTDRTVRGQRVFVLFSNVWSVA